MGKTIDVSLGHVIVFLPSGKVYLENYREIMSKINSLKSIEALSTRLEVEGIAVCGEKIKALLVVGLKPETISKVLTIEENVAEGRFLREEDKGVAVLGDGLANELNVSLNLKSKYYPQAGRK